jgi:hypothetical protein
MWFKLTYSLRGMYQAHSIDAPVCIPLPDDSNAEIVLWLRTIESGILPKVCCDVIVERQIKPDLAAMFESLSKRVLPRDKSTSIKLPYPVSSSTSIDRNGNIPENWHIPLSIMPTKFQELSRSVSNKLSGLAHKFIKTLRWTQGAAGPHSPFSHVGFQWSNDKVHWNTMPSEFYASLEVLVGLDVRPDAIRRVEEIGACGEEEPFAHELMREAFDIAATNPRSALLIGCSALETALKEYLNLVVPNSYIILEEVPSPPVLKIMQEIIPRLYKQLKVSDSAFALKEHDKKLAKNWVHQRNKIAHGAKIRVDVDRVRMFLRFVRKILYQLDACRGHAWAVSLTFTDEDDC